MTSEAAYPEARAGTLRAPGRYRSKTRRVQGPPPVPGGSPWIARFQRLELGAYWRFFVKQPPSFWFVSLYLFFEYVRPQSIYTALDVLPWALGTIVLTTIAVLFEGKMFRGLDRSEGWLAFFSAVLVISCFTAYLPAESFAELELFLTWVLVFVLITRCVDTPPRFFFYYALFLLFSLKMSQHASRAFLGAGGQFRAWGASGAPGWFQNSGEMAIQMTIFLPMSICFFMAVKPYLVGLSSRWRYWAVALLPVSAVLALLASSSRGGQLGGVAVGLWFLMRSRMRVRGLIVAAVFGAAAFALLPEQQRARFTEMGSDDTSVARLTFWRNGIEIANDHPVLGIGYGNWATYYASEGYRSQPGSLLPHNIFVQAGAELGYTGLAAFLMLIVTTFRMNSVSRRLARRLPDGEALRWMALGLNGGLVGFMVSGFFVTVLYYPYFWVSYALTAALYKTVKRQARQIPDPARRTGRQAGSGRVRPPRQFARADTG